jgi:predicted NUDIX family NTP pyrophosphohydrolase
VPSSKRRSAGLLVHRGAGAELEVLLVHPGGPMWSKRDAGAWSIPKGEYDSDEEPLAAARREFAEELGVAPPDGPARDLGEVRQKSGKVVHGWAVEGDLDVSEISSNMVTVQWPPRSGQTLEIPEVDRAEWFGPELAREKINPAQAVLLDRLSHILEASTS